MNRSANTKGVLCCGSTNTEFEEKRESDIKASERRGLREHATLCSYVKKIKNKKTHSKAFLKRL